MESTEMIDEILKIAVESYNQENSRTSVLTTKTNQLIVNIIATFGFINAFCAFLLKVENISQKVIVISYLIVSISLCIDLFLSINALCLKKAVFFPTALSILENIDRLREKGDNIESIHIKNDIPLYYDQYTKAMEKVNNTKAKCLIWAYYIYLVSLVIIAISFLIMTMIS